MSILAQVLADPQVARIFEALGGGGEETRIAGGAVRDVLIGKIPTEIDFATTALPDEVVRRAAAAKLRMVPTGIAHGTVTVLVDGRPFEVTTLRRDVETDGRHAVVAFGRDWSEDAKRRDFTINGLFLDRGGKVHDFVGGEADLQVRRVRFIGDAKTRIREDYLRILRFFRFFAGYDDGAPDADALSSAISERRGLEHLSRERVRAELLKFLIAPRAPDAAKIMADAGLLGMVLGGVARPRNFARLADIELKLGVPPDAVARLGVLSLFIPENADRLRDRLRLSNDETERLRGMAGRPVITPDLQEQGRKAAFYMLGARVFCDRALFGWAESGADARPLVEFAENWTAPKFPVGAAQLIERGVEKGPHLGAVLARIEDDWIAAGFPDDAVSLDRLIARGIEAITS